MLKINTLRTFIKGFRQVRTLLLGRSLVRVALASTLLVGCGDGDGRRLENPGKSASCAETPVFESMEYSRLLRLGTQCGRSVVEIRSIVGGDTLVKRFNIEKPISRVATLSSSQIGFISRLGMDGRIVAVGEGKFVSDCCLYRRIFSREEGNSLDSKPSSSSPACHGHFDHDDIDLPMREQASACHCTSCMTAAPRQCRCKHRRCSRLARHGHFVPDSFGYQMRTQASALDNLACHCEPLGEAIEASHTPRSAAPSAVQSCLPSKVAQVGNGSSLNLEKLIAIKPDLVMTFATGGSEDDYLRLEGLGIATMLTSEWQEEDPLAKAEWIKLYGTLFGCRPLADSIFEQSKIMYESCRKATSQRPAGIQPDRPRVIAGMAYGGVWYAPGGSSYTAKLIRDAGGRYLWEGDSSREMRLSLEEVLSLGDSADVWINPGMFSTPEEILSVDPRVSSIRAFREHRVFQNDARLGPGGGNDFFEGAITRPGELLYNMVECLQGRPVPDSGAIPGKSTYRWYRNIYNSRI